MSTLKHLSSLLLVFLLASHSLWAQVEVTTVGTDFWFGYLSNYENDSDALQVFISSESPASGNIEIPGLGWAEPFVTIPGVTTVIDVPFGAEHLGSGVVDNKGVHITSDIPIAVYCINYQGFTSDGTRILPKPFLDIEYVVSGYPGLSAGSGYMSEMLIVATEDGTELEITPACNMEPGIPAGVPFLIQLDAGESYQLKAEDASLDVTGTMVIGTEESGDCRPFAVFGGSECPNIPIGCTACDHIFDQTLPTAVWGSEYLLVPYQGSTSYTYRVMAYQDGTNVSIDGVPSFTLNTGEFQEFNDVSEAIYVSADNNVNVIQYMEGTSCAGSGDPAMSSLNSNSQTMDQITFATVVSGVINQHNLNVIVASTFINDVFLDGAQIPGTDFTPFPGNPIFSYAQIVITEGSHTLECENGFIGYIYGTGGAESYAYPAGAIETEPVDPIISVTCDDGQVILQGDPNYLDPWWSTLSEPEDTVHIGQPFIIDPPIINEIYVLHGNNFLSGCPEEEIFSVESPEVLEVSIIEDSIELCIFQEYTFSPTVDPPGNEYLYNWSNENAFVISDEENGIISPFESGYYYLDVTTFSGCSEGQDSVYLTILGGDITYFDAVAIPEVACEGDTVFLNAETGVNLDLDLLNAGTSPTLWTGFAGETLDNVCGSMSGDALYFDGEPTRFAETADFDLSEGGIVSFAIQISDGSGACDGTEFGEDVFLEYSTNGGGVWNPMFTLFEGLYPTFQTIQVPVPDPAQTAATRFRWIQPTFSAALEDVWMLDNVSINSFAPSGNAYVWSATEPIDDVNAQSTFALPLAGANYIVEMVSSGCTFTDSVFVELESDFDLDITNDTSLCDAAGIQLQVTPNLPGLYTYQWDNGALLNSSVVSSPLATPFATTTFTVEVTSEAGCVNTDSVTVQVLDTQNLNILTTATTLCTGQTATLTPSLVGSLDNYTFSWTPEESVDDPNAFEVVVSPDVNTLFQVVVTDTVNNCSISADIDIFVNELVLELPPDTSLCDSEGFQVVFDFIPGFQNIFWNNTTDLDNPFTLFPTIIVPDLNDTLILTIEDFFLGCTVTDTIIISTQDIAYDAPDVLSVCPESSVQAEIDGDFTSISWVADPDLNAADPDSPVFSNDEDTYFFYSMTSSAGCVIDDSIEIVVNIPASFEIIGDTLCEGETIVLQVPVDGQSYLWNTTDDSQNLFISEAGLYSVTVTDTSGCSIADDILITEEPLPEFDITGILELCVGETSTLTADITGVDYLWSTFSNEQTIDVTTSGIVWVEVTDDLGCVFRDSVDMTFRPPPLLDLATAGAICEDTGTVLTASAEEVEYLWETLETTPSIEVLEEGYYTVTVTDPFDCATTDSIFAQQILFPPAQNLDTFFCAESVVVLRPEEEPGFDISWSTGSQVDTLPVSIQGQYQLILDRLNCQKKYPFFVTEEPNPTLELTREGLFCDLDFPDGYPVFASSDGFVIWEELVEDTTYLVFQEDIYEAIAYSDSGCITVDEIFVPLQCVPRVFIPNAFTPDDDGLNDFFKIMITGVVDKYELVIFDRWGQEVFRSNDPNQAWNGSIQGGEYFAEDGVYQYILEFEAYRDVPEIISEKRVGQMTLVR